MYSAVDVSSRWSNSTLNTLIMGPKRKNTKGRRRGDSSEEEPDNTKGKAGANKSQGHLSSDSFITLMVDPRRIRFAHSRVRPVFSGGNHTLEGTLEAIRSGVSTWRDIPIITVIEGPRGENRAENWYFSLNNRRLWVFKQCREEGLLSEVRVRARGPKAHEIDRYTLEKCSNTATLMREKHVGLGQGLALGKADECESEGKDEESSEKMRGDSDVECEDECA